jgi:hypothetical protein
MNCRREKAMSSCVSRAIRSEPLSTASIFARVGWALGDVAYGLHGAHGGAAPVEERGGVLPQDGRPRREALHAELGREETAVCSG